MEEDQVALEMVLHVRDDIVKNRSKTPHFHVKINHRIAPWRGRRLIEQPFAII